MNKYLSLLPGFLMFIGYFFFKLYKMIKYSIKVSAKIVKHNDNYYKTATDGFWSTSRHPIYEYSYQGRLYYYRSKIGIGGIEGRKRVNRKIRINKNNPKKVYVSYIGLQLMYFFFNFIVLFQGWILYVINNY